MPAPNWAIAHFGLHGAAFIVTAESCNEPVAAQYVVAHGLGDRQGVRFWTTVVLPEFRMIGVASYLTAVSTHITRSWAQFGSTICDTDSSLMGRNVKLQPLIVTANMYHTPGRNKVQLEWAKPEDPFKAFFDSSQVPQLDPNLPVIQSLLRYDLGELPQSFKAKPDSYVWEDIALYPHKYYRHFRLSGWVGSEKMAVLSDAKIRLQAEENSNNSIRLEEEGNLDFQARV
ncbi:hypothetical protein HYT59_00215 [Candidatus Woesebacteria bacterium]|nr:hypothetical protein [Candidatus Woesebacteria bacterium]